MPVTPPTSDDLRAIGDWYGLRLSDREVDAHTQVMDLALASLERLEELDEMVSSLGTPDRRRDPGHRPEPDENPLNAWYWLCSLDEASSGPLAGKTIGIKDNIAVAGMPMMVGSALFEGCVPNRDATVVERILRAGGRIVGKTVCEPLCMSDSSHLADTGPVRNPHDPTRSAGGSSSGSAALVVAGDCDIALGSDSAGSIRMPSSLCGAFGLKPTYGLVPRTGLFPVERTLDHVGPIAANVEDLAVLLEVIAGPEREADGRPYADGVEVRSLLDDGIEGVRIGLVEEGFARPGADPAVDDAVRAACSALAEVGAEVARVSIPWHLDGEHIWAGIAMEGAYNQVLRGNGAATNVDEIADLDMVEAMRRGRADRAHLLPDPVKSLVLAGEHLRRTHGGTYYTRARRLVPELRRAYDDALSRFDVLVMPTTPTTAPPLPDPDAPIEAHVAAAFALHGNTCPLNVTGHPAMNIPCGPVGGLPVGLMAVAAKGADGILFRLARACEASGISSMPAAPRAR